MIHVSPAKKLNDFKVVRCVKPSDLYARFGKRMPDTDFESNMDEQLPLNMSKIDSIEYLERYDSMMSERESAGTGAESNVKNTDSASE